MSPVRKVWLGTLAVLLVSASIYPVLGTPLLPGSRTGPFLPAAILTSHRPVPYGITSRSMFLIRNALPGDMHRKPMYPSVRGLS